MFPFVCITGDTVVDFLTPTEKSCTSSGPEWGKNMKIAVQEHKNNYVNHYCQ